MTAQDAPAYYQPVPVAWDDEAILRAAGNNPEGVHALLKQSRQKLPSRMAVYQWISRKRIASAWRGPLLYSLFRANQITPAKLFRVARPREAAE